MESSGKSVRPGEGQRVLAAIVFTDISAFSARMHHDEPRTIRLADRDLALIRSICEEHGGEVLKNTGDGLLMFFASAQDAMATALQAQQAIHEQNEKLPPNECLLHRIGIHLGDVYVRNQDVLGDGVNVAARLLGEAEPGGICFSQTVYDVIKNRMEVKATYLGPRELKNISDAVPVYQVRVISPSQSSVIAALTEQMVQAPRVRVEAAKPPAGAGHSPLAIVALLVSVALGAVAVWVALRRDGGPSPTAGSAVAVVATPTLAAAPTPLPTVTPPAPATPTASPTVAPTSTAMPRPAPPSPTPAVAVGVTTAASPTPTRTAVPATATPAATPAPARGPLMTADHLRAIYDVLLDYALAHEGDYPPDEAEILRWDAASKKPRLAPPAWTGPEFEPAFAYQDGLRSTDPVYLVLGYRVATDEQGRRLVLFVGGEIRLQTVDQLRRALEVTAQHRQAATQPAR